jgi:hypothetical protein
MAGGALSRSAIKNPRLRVFSAIYRIGEYYRNERDPYGGTLFRAFARGPRFW